MKQNKHIIIKNIYYMLCYAFETVMPKEETKIAGEEFEDMKNLFAAIMVKGVSHQVKQGLYREYTDRNENLSTMRGKVNMNGTIRNRLMKRQKLCCEFDEFSEDNLFNRIIKTTILLLIRQPEVEKKYKDELKRLLMFFSETGETDLSQVQWNRLVFGRNNRSYRVLISICQFIAEGMLLTSESGEHSLRNFADEQAMCRLYEKFVREYYRKEYPQLNASASHIPWAVDDDYTTFLPTMKTDIVLSYGEKILIIDTKYYGRTLQTNYERKSQHSGNMYQIFAYVKNKRYEIESKGDNRKVSGMILYAKTDEDIAPDQEYSIDGDKIRVKTLDLNCEFNHIKEQLDEIANHML